MEQSNLKFTSANNRWIIETKFPYTDNFEHLLYEGGEDISYRTLTNFGSQRDLDLEKNKELIDILQSQINEEFKEQKMPCRVLEATRLWNIIYRQNGYQCIHSHTDEGFYDIMETKKGVLSVVISFDTIPHDQTNYMGCLYALLPEPDGTIHYKIIPSLRGKMTIFDGAVWHGVYPTPQERRVLVCDMNYELTI